MPRKTPIVLAALLVALTTVAAVADALVLTEEERLGDVADALSDAEPGRRVDGVLRYFEPSRETVVVREGSRGERFVDGDEIALAEHVRESLSFLEGADAEWIQRSVSVQGPMGTVALRVRTAGVAHDLTFQLQRHDDRWLVRHLQVR